MTPSTDRYRLCLRIAIAAAVFAGSASAQHYDVKPLVSNTASPDVKPDSNLVNAWGIARSSTSPWWVSDNGTAMSTLYNGSGDPQSLVVAVPGAPTGVVFNGSSDFEVASGMPARFLFASEDGTISGWNPMADQTHAKVLATKEGAIYKGLAIATANGKHYLYAADFHNHRIDVFDTRFEPVTLGSKSFVPFRFGNELRGLAPFNIQNIGGNLFIAFAKPDEAGEDEVAGPGNGAIGVFSPEGHRLGFFEHVDALNAPWGMTLAPSDFGAFSHHLLVGQFGSGEVLAFNFVTGRFAGKLLEPKGQPVKIDGIWGIGFGNGGNAGPANTLFFAAGPNEEKDGLFGMVTAVPAEQTLGNGS